MTHLVSLTEGAKFLITIYVVQLASDYSTDLISKCTDTPLGCIAWLVVGPEGEGHVISVTCPFVIAIVASDISQTNKESKVFWFDSKSCKRQTPSTKS